MTAKTATFAYNNAGQFSSVGRYQNATTTNLVATGAYGYDSAGELTSIDYADGQGNTLDNFSWTYDALGNVATSTSSLDGPSGTVKYTSDSTGQLTGASGGQPASESYVYDANGNRETVTTNGNQVTCVTGPDNELLYDGTYTYSYDAEGNQTARWIASTTSPLETQPGAGDTDITIYTWDNRDRLTSVTTYDNYADYSAATPVPTQTVTYIYDAFNRWIGETITTTGSGTTQTRYVYDGNQIVMQFDGPGDGTGALALTAANLSHRYLWGPAVDQLMADEQLSAPGGSDNLTTPGNVVWALTDNENTVRDLATYDPTANGGEGTTTIVNHRVFSAYGELLSQTNPATGSTAAVDCLFAYTGRPLDTATGLQNNDNRWYDAVTGRWLSQDPIEAGTNFFCYCGDDPAANVDPAGIAWTTAGVASILAGAPSGSGSAAQTYIANNNITVNVVGGISLATKGGVQNFDGYSVPGTINIVAGDNANNYMVAGLIVHETWHLQNNTYDPNLSPEANLINNEVGAFTAQINFLNSLLESFGNSPSPEIVAAVNALQSKGFAQVTTGKNGTKHVTVSPTIRNTIANKYHPPRKGAQPRIKGPTTNITNDILPNQTASNNTTGLLCLC